MKKNDFLTLLDWTPDDIRAVIGLAAALKSGRGAAETRVLAGKTGVLIFEKPSLRTRVTFETAIHELGGHALNLASEAVGMGKRESVEDVARTLEGVVHLIIARTFAHDTVVRLAATASVPVINALTDEYHPCQALAFALTLHELRPDKKLNIVLVGDGNNVCNSIMIMCAKLGHNFTVASPKGYEPNAEIVNKCRAIGESTGSDILITTDPRAAMQSADAVYTDVWASMGQEAEAEERRKVFHPLYQLNSELISLAPKDVLVSHCLPAHRGEEITSDVLDSPNSVAFREAENRLHVQKAVITRLFS